MQDETAERRSSPRHHLVLAVDVVELPRGAKLSARAADLSRTGCYIDTLNTIPQGSTVRLRMAHQAEVFETLGRVIYVSPGLGMGIAFEAVADEQMAMLDRWLAETDREF